MRKSPPAPPGAPASLRAKALLVFLSLTVTLAALELLLRACWLNPARFTVVGVEWPGYLRLQNGNVNARYDIAGLYPGARFARFRTEADGAIVRDATAAGPLANVYGGSTTECRYVDEGRRWPELIPSVAARNYGVSGNNLLDSYFNFVFHLQSPATTPRVAIFMEAVNDWSARNVFTPELYLANYERAWGRDRRSNLMHPTTGWYLSDLVAIVRRNISVPTNVTELYRIAAREQRAKKIPPLPEVEFTGVLALMQRKFLPDRAKLIGRITRIGRERGIQIVFVTQPNAYRVDYHAASGDDFRIFPDWENQLMSAQQAGRLLDAINENTRQAATAEGAGLIDVAAEFSRLQPGPLFYDSVHLTAEGCSVFAGIVEAGLATPPRTR